MCRAWMSPVQDLSSPACDLSSLFHNLSSKETLAKIYLDLSLLCNRCVFVCVFVCVCVCECVYLYVSACA